MTTFSRCERWTLEEAIPVCRRIETRVRPLGYHTLLGGGVLHRGASDKDLDIFVLPLYNETIQKVDPQAIREAIAAYMDGGQLYQFHEGPCSSVGDMAKEYSEDSHPGKKLMLYGLYNTRRVDIFIH